MLPPKRSRPIKRVVRAEGEQASTQVERTLHSFVEVFADYAAFHFGMLQNGFWSEKRIQRALTTLRIGAQASFLISALLAYLLVIFFRDLDPSPDSLLQLKAKLSLPSLSVADHLWALVPLLLVPTVISRMTAQSLGKVVAVDEVLLKRASLLAASQALFLFCVVTVAYYLIAAASPTAEMTVSRYFKFIFFGTLVFSIYQGELLIRCAVGNTRQPSARIAPQIASTALSLVTTGTAAATLVVCWHTTQPPNVLPLYSQFKSVSDAEVGIEFVLQNPTDSWLVLDTNRMYVVVPSDRNSNLINGGPEPPLRVDGDPQKLLVAEPKKPLKFNVVVKRNSKWPTSLASREVHHCVDLWYEEFLRFGGRFMRLTSCKRET